MKKSQLRKIIREVIREQMQPTSGDCAQVQSLIDPNMFSLLCQANCNSPIVTQPGGPIANLISCCNPCPQEPTPPSPPIPQDQVLCKKVLDIYVPQEFGMGGLDFCKKKCKGKAIEMISLDGGDPINACKCCSLLPSAPPPTGGFSNISASEVEFECAPGTTFQGGSVWCGNATALFAQGMPWNNSPTGATTYQGYQDSFQNQCCV